MAEVCLGFFIKSYQLLTFNLEAKKLRIIALNKRIYPYNKAFAKNIIIDYHILTN